MIKSSLATVALVFCAIQHFPSVALAQSSSPTLEAKDMRRAPSANVNTCGLGMQLSAGEGMEVVVLHLTTSLPGGKIKDVRLVDTQGNAYPGNMGEMYSMSSDLCDWGFKVPVKSQLAKVQAEVNGQLLEASLKPVAAPAPTKSKKK